MRLRPVFVAALALALCTPLWAQGPDPLKSAECKVALDELERVLAEDTPGPRRARQVTAARQRAAHACLGRGGGDARVRSGAPQPPQVVRPPPVITVAPPAPVSPAVTNPAPPLGMPRPTVITTCDPAGCWDSEGRRLTNMAPLLMGPRGPCTVQGGLANCP